MTYLNNTIISAKTTVDTNIPLAVNNLFSHIKIKNVSKFGKTVKLNIFENTFMVLV
jgi:hypothetical protein